MAKKNTKTVKKSKTAKKPETPVLAKWEGWDAYFSSKQGTAQLADTINGIGEVLIRNQWRPTEKFDKMRASKPDHLAIEMLSIDPRLGKFIPAKISSSVGDIQAAAMLARIGEQQEPSHLEKSRKDLIFAAFAMMYHGISLVKLNYTGGSDQIDYNSSEVFAFTDESMEDAEVCSEDFISQLDKVYGITPEIWFDLCNDSGAGDGSGYWTNDWCVAFFGDGFRCYTDEGDFTEYDCDTCDLPQSECECVWSDEESRYITIEEQNEKKAAEEEGQAKTKGKKKK